MTEAPKEDIGLQKEKIDPLPDIVVTLPLVGTSGVTVQVIVTRSVMGEGFVLLIATILGGMLNNSTATQMTTGDKGRVTLVEEEVVMMRKILSIILILFISSSKPC